MSTTQNAQLETIDLCRLQQSEQERSRLYEACQFDGFFYMDLRGAAQDIDNAVADIYALQRELFSLPPEKKMIYDIDLISPRKLNGYKPVGRNHGEINGRSDGFESYALSKDGLTGLSKKPFLRPEVVEPYLSSLQRFCGIMSEAIRMVLSSLSTSLVIESGLKLEEMHPTHLPTPDLIRLLKYCSYPAHEQGASHVPHTDLGSLTFLFTEQPGLQVKPATGNSWKWVEPRANHAIVNIGDSLAMLSGGLFKSCLHRVVAPVANTSREERYSFAYFCRAEDSTPMRPVSSPLIRQVSWQDSQEQETLTSIEWLQRKYKALRADTWGQQNNWMLTAGR